jgi:hypothetical protein
MIPMTTYLWWVAWCNNCSFCWRFQGELTARNQARNQALNQARNSPVEAPNDAPNNAPNDAIDEAPNDAIDADDDEAPIDADDDISPILEGNDIWTPQLQQQIEQIDALADVLAPNTASSEHVSSPKVAWATSTPPAAVPMTPFLFAFAVWCDRASISRSDYAALLEVIQLARNTPEVWKQVPNTLDTLQHRYQAQIPTSPIYEHQIDLRLDKLPTGQSGTGKVYYFDPIEFTKTILRSDLRRHMHFGMAQLVEKASELWHGDAWAESIRTCSGEFALYPDGTPYYPT